MPLICMQCVMRHVVEALEAGRDPAAPPSFEETPDEHMAAHHPDQAVVAAERRDLERRIAELPYEAFLLLNHDLGNQTPPKERH
jgi:hypothetical protein